MAKASRPSRMASEKLEDGLTNDLSLMRQESRKAKEFLSMKRTWYLQDRASSCHVQHDVCFEIFVFASLVFEMET